MVDNVSIVDGGSGSLTERTAVVLWLQRVPAERREPCTQCGSRAGCS